MSLKRKFLRAQAVKTSALRCRHGRCSALRKNLSIHGGFSCCNGPLKKKDGFMICETCGASNGEAPPEPPKISREEARLLYQQLAFSSLSVHDFKLYH